MTNVAFRAGLLVIVYSLALVLIGVSVCWIAHGEQYKYEMNKEELAEYRLMELCYLKANITIGSLQDFCRTHYGDIDSFYGDKYNESN